jgi:hypothetical protein
MPPPPTTPKTPRSMSTPAIVADAPRQLRSSQSQATAPPSGRPNTVKGNAKRPPRKPHVHGDEGPAEEVDKSEGGDELVANEGEDPRAVISASNENSKRPRPKPRARSHN